MFTGDTQDILATLNCCFDTPNRELSATQGRWFTPDPAGLSAVDPTNPQTWNRYAYVMDTPLSNIDPTGLGPCPNFQLECPASGDPIFGFTEFDFITLAIRPTGYMHYLPDGGVSGPIFGNWWILDFLGSQQPKSPPANYVQSRVRLEQIANHLKNCGGVYPLVAASAGNFKIGSSPGNYAETSPTDDAGNGFNGGNSTTTIDANNFANANPVTQTGVVVHEWFHTMQINNSSPFRFSVFFNRQSVENEANAAAKEALQKCGPG